jgi:hypothetical protein
VPLLDAAVFRAQRYVKHRTTENVSFAHIFLLLVGICIYSSYELITAVIQLPIIRLAMPLCQIFSLPQDPKLDAISSRTASQLQNKKKVHTELPTAVLFEYDWADPWDYLAPLIEAKARYQRRMNFADK